MSGEYERAASVGYAALEIGRRTGAVVVAAELHRLSAWRGVPDIGVLAEELDAHYPHPA